MIADNKKKGKTAKIILSALDNISHPVTLVRPSPLAMNHLLFHNLAYQHDELALPEKAEVFSASLRLNPDQKDIKDLTNRIEAERR